MGKYRNGGTGIALLALMAIGQWVLFSNWTNVTFEPFWSDAIKYGAIATCGWIFVVLLD